MIKDEFWTGKEKKQCLHYNYRPMVLLEKHYTKTIICVLSLYLLPSTSYIQSKSCPNWAIALAQLFYVQCFILSAPLQEMYWISFKNYVFFIICVWVLLLASMFIYHVHVVSPEARIGHQILWNWSYTQLARTYHGCLQEQ